MATEIVAITFFFITIMVFIVSYFKTRHSERMALINSDRTAKIFDHSDTDSNNALKLGLFLLSIGLGLMVGLMVDRVLASEPAGVFVSIFICGGISLIYYHTYIEKKGNRNDKDENDLV